MTTLSQTRGVPSVLQLLANDLRWRLVTILARSDYQVHELVRLLEQPGNLVSYHLKRLRQGELVRERRSSVDRRDVYYSLDLARLQDLYVAAGAAVHPGLGRMAEVAHAGTDAQAEPKRRARVLFLCTHNSARSQMAEGILRLMGGDSVEVASAGSEPTAIHPEAIRVLASLGIDASAYRSKHFTQLQGEHFDYIISVCDRVREACPVFPGDPERSHWSFPDPTLIEDDPLRRETFEHTARQLSTRIRFLLTLIEGDRQRVSDHPGIETVEAKEAS